MLRSLAIVLFVLGTLPMAFVEPFVGLLLWVLFSYMNPNREAYGFANNFHWVFIIAAITLFSMIINSDKVRRIEWKALPVFLILFLCSTGMTTIFAVEHSYAVAQWTQFMKVQVMVFATLMLVYDRKRLHWMLWVIVLSFGFWAVKGGVFTILKGGQYRVIGPENTFIGGRNQLALALCMVLPLMRYLQLQAKTIYVRWMTWALMGMTVLSILGTYSREGLITIVAVTFLLIMKGRRRFSILILVLISLPLLLNFMPQHWKNRMYGLESGHAVASESFQGRVQSWEFATSVGLHFPFSGGGFGVWKSDKMWNQYGPPGAIHRAIHSIFFQVLGEQGLLGFGLYMIILGLAWRNLAVVRKRTRGDPENRWLSDLAGFMQVSLAAYIVAGSALPQGYFDFTYQLAALSVIIRRFAESPESLDGESSPGRGLKVLGR
jgi:probable O-glycosylation ligase (exosortase A-associated)